MKADHIPATTAEDPRTRLSIYPKRRRYDGRPEGWDNGSRDERVGMRGYDSAHSTYGEGPGNILVR